MPRGAAAGHWRQHRAQSAQPAVRTRFPAHLPAPVWAEPGLATTISPTPLLSRRVQQRRDERGGSVVSGPPPFPSGGFSQTVQEQIPGPRSRPLRLIPLQLFPMILRNVCPSFTRFSPAPFVSASIYQFSPEIYITSLPICPFQRQGSWAGRAVKRTNEGVARGVDLPSDLEALSGHSDAAWPWVEQCDGLRRTRPTLSPCHVMGADSASETRFCSSKSVWSRCHSLARRGAPCLGRIASTWLDMASSNVGSRSITLPLPFIATPSASSETR